MPAEPSCCSTPDLPPATDEQVDRIFKALASKQRRQILALLAAGENGDSCCSSEDLCGCVFVERLGIGAPTVSHHMKVLAEAGLVTAEKRGSWVYYRLDGEAVRRVAGEMIALWGCAG